MDEYYLYTFSSTHAAIQTEKLLSEAEARVMPVPRFISASCGISVRIKPENSELADEIMLNKGTLDQSQYSYYHVIKNADNGEVDCTQLR
ncbi:MAG: DUF3343 domain-containing protein [Clostridiales bacterium]|jgi:hypothetical protein|nr:DUF3343 domain-containing protein [Clostridiales bacterium]